METFKFWFMVISASGGSGFTHGFHSGLLNTLAAVVMNWYDDIEWYRYGIEIDDFKGIRSFIWSSFALGAFIGSFLICVSCMFCGRKILLIAYNAFNIFSLFLLSFSFLSNSWELFIFARILVGINAGFSSGITVIYLMEISPYCVRGAAGSIYYLMTALSITFAFLLGLEGGLGTERSWPLIFIVGYFPAFCQICCMIFCPESPKYLYFNKNDEEGTEDSLLWYRGELAETDFEELEEERLVLDDIEPVTAADLCQEPVFRNPLIIVSVMMFGQQMCGFNGLLYFSTDLFDSLAYDKATAEGFTILLGICNIIGAIICVCIVDRIGRKPLLLISLGSMLMSQMLYTMALILATYEDVIPDQIAHVGTFFLFIFALAFGLGAGPIPWFYVAEVCNHFARPGTACIAIAIGWFSHFLCVITYLFLEYYLGVYVFVIYFAINSVVATFIYFTMRETQDLSASDIAELYFD